MTAEQIDLFGALVTAPPPAPAVAAYARYEMKQVRHVCGRCHRAAHLAERAGGIPARPTPASWRRQCGGPDTVEHLCYRHKAEAHAEDTAAGRIAKPVPGRRGARVTA